MGTHEPGGNVAANAKALRGRRGLSVRELSARMAELGHPLLPSGITKIEQGQRRVDAGELVALAVALGVNPNALLLPADASSRPVQLTERVAVPWERAWEWATGEAPLDVSSGKYERLSDLAQWFEITRPHKDPDEIAAEVAAARQVRLDQLKELEDEVQAGRDRAGAQRKRGDSGGEHREEA